MERTGAKLSTCGHVHSIDHCCTPIIKQVEFGRFHNYEYTHSNVGNQYNCLRLYMTHIFEALGIHAGIGPVKC